MRTVLQIILAACCVWAAAALGGAADEAADETKASATKTPMRRVPAGSQYRGMALQLHRGRDAYDHYHRLVPEIADLGANTVMFVVHGWQMHAGSLDLHVDQNRTPSDEDLGRLLDLAAVHGLRRILMPVVLLKNPRTGEWRGKIVPPGHDWDAWFERYQKFVLKYARVAEKHGVEVFMVGSELIKAERHTREWRDTIAVVRNVYGGALGYSANWDHYQTKKIGFWDALDIVGMTSYYELAEGPNPKIEEIDANWRRIKKEILTFQREVDLPIMFTEIGWCSQEGAAHEGWNYYASEKATAAGQREQALLYEAFMKAWTHEPAVQGMIWWEWTASKGGPTDYGYTPKGKLAETYLRLWFQNKPPPKRPEKSTALRR